MASWNSHWRVPLGINMYPVAADVDGDGRRELVVCALAGHPVCAINVDGAVLWEVDVQPDNAPDGMAYPDPTRMPDGRWVTQMDVRRPGLYEGTAVRHNDWVYQPALLDVDGDGREEVIAGRRGHLCAIDGSSGNVVKQWHIPGDAVPGGDAIGYFFVIRSDGERRLVVPTRLGGVFCLDEQLEQVRWQSHLPMPAHWAFAGDVDGDGSDEILWAYDCTGTPHNELGVVWLLSADGEERWRRFTDEIMDDTHLDYALMLPPTDQRDGLIVMPDGPAFDANGDEVFNVRQTVHHGQRVALIRDGAGDDLLIYADRGVRASGNDEAWLGTTGVVATDLNGHVLWQRRDLTDHSGHRISDGWPVRGGDGESDLYAAGELGNWGGTRHRGVGDYYVYLMRPDGEVVQTIRQRDTGANGKGYPYPGACGMGFDLDGDGHDELYVITSDGTWSQYRTD